MRSSGATNFSASVFPKARRHRRTRPTRRLRRRRRPQDKDRSRRSLAGDPSSPGDALMQSLVRQFVERIRAPAGGSGSDEGIVRPDHRGSDPSGGRRRRPPPCASRRAARCSSGCCSRSRAAASATSRRRWWRRRCPRSAGPKSSRRTRSRPPRRRRTASARPPAPGAGAAPAPKVRRRARRRPAPRLPPPPRTTSPPRREPPRRPARRRRAARSGARSARGRSRTARPTAPAASTSPAACRRSRSTPPTRRTCSAARPTAGSGKASTAAPAGAPRTDYAATLTVGALAFDRRAPATVYCGTGEGNWWSWLGAGILRSTDGGTTWSTLCTAPFVGQGFYDLIVDPAASRRLFAATNGGLYISTDGGVTWTRRRAAATWSLSISPAGGATAEILAACSDGLFRSTNRGVDLDRVALPGVTPPFDRLAVAIAPSNPAVAYAWGAQRRDRLRCSGAPAAPGRAVPVPPGVSTGQAWYDWYLAVAPDSADADLLRRDRDASRRPGRRRLDLDEPQQQGATGDSIHPDQHAIAFEPGDADTIYIGNDGGLFRSADRGITWQHCNNGLVITEFEYLGAGLRVVALADRRHPGQRHRALDRVAGLGPRRRRRRRRLRRQPHRRPRPCFHTYYGMSPRALDHRRRLRHPGPGSPPPVPAGEGQPLLPAVRGSANGGDTVAIGGDALYVSRNNGTTWTRLGFPAGGAVERAVASRTPTPSTSALTDGRVFRTHLERRRLGALDRADHAARRRLRQRPPRRSGQRQPDLGDLHARSAAAGCSAPTTAARTGPTAPPGCRTCRSTPSQVDPGNAQPGLGRRRPRRLPEPRRRRHVGATSPASLPNAFVGDLLFHPHARVLRAGTRNRGVWEIPVDGWMTSPDLRRAVDRDARRQPDASAGSPSAGPRPGT